MPDLLAIVIHKMPYLLAIILWEHRKAAESIKKQRAPTPNPTLKVPSTPPTSPTPAFEFLCTLNPDSISSDRQF